MYNNNRAPRWREGSILLKDFYLLSKDDKYNYVESLLKIPVHHQGDTDEFILHFFYKKKSKQFLDLTEEL
jgi:hypothetical protein